MHTYTCRQLVNSHGSFFFFQEYYRICYGTYESITFSKLFIFHFVFLKDTKPSLPRTCLPSMIPNFTGRQKECEKITCHVTSESTRIVSIWGSPGFGKTSVATAVGHHLNSQGLPVYFLSLRGVQSKTDLTSKLLSFFRHSGTNDKPSQRLSLDDELFRVLSEISDRFVLILDNADEFFESRMIKVKEDFINSLEDILTRTKMVTFVITTRESFEFMNVHFQGHQAVRIRPLDESSSQSLVNELLPNATASDCRRITQICGNVPLAIKLLCSSISEDDVHSSKVLDDFMVSLESNNIIEMLDNPDYPSHLRLKLLFDSSFQRLSAQEKEALVSLSVLPESFDLTIAAAVLDKSQIPMAKKILHSLRRKSFLDSSSKPGLFSIHKLLESFAREKGEHEMKETFIHSKCRLCAFYVSRFEKLNEQFLSGNSLKAFIDFYEDEQSIVQSLVEGCSDSKTANSVFEVLVKAELFLYSLYWRERANFYKIYDSAIKMAKMFEENVFYRQLLVSRAFYQVTWTTGGTTIQQLSEVDEIEASCSPVSNGDKGKHLCYSGICHLISGNTEDGVQCLVEALSLMINIPEQRILRIIAFQILAVYYRFEKNQPVMSLFYSEAVQECRAAGDTKLLVINTMESTDKERDGKEVRNQPLKLAILCLISEATKHLNNYDTKRAITRTAQQMAKQIEKPLVPCSLGLLIFQHNVKTVVARNVTPYHETIIICCQEEAVSQFTKPISFPTHERTRELSAPRLHSLPTVYPDTAESYTSLEDTQDTLLDFISAVKSTKRALDIRLKLFGEEHSSTADNYYLLGVTQHTQGDFTSAIQSTQRALDIRRKLFGEEHSSTADSYFLLGASQYEQNNFTSALYSIQRALNVRRKLFGEGHSDTADSYCSLGVIQHAQGDFTSAIQYTQSSLDIRRKLHGEEHSSTADSYYSLGKTQHAQGDFFSAIQSKQRALDIRRKLFGEGHSSTADSYLSVGKTRHAQGYFTSALLCKQRALEIRRELFGEGHLRTADSYYLLGKTQHAQGDFVAAFQSKQRALDIRQKLFGEEHSSTADSYFSLGKTQHAQGDFVAAIQSKQRALDIRRKLFGEEHSSTADSYYLLGKSQHAQGDSSSAFQSFQRALDIRRKLFGEEHPKTVASHRSLYHTRNEISTADSGCHIL